MTTTSLLKQSKTGYSSFKSEGTLLRSLRELLRVCGEEVVALRGQATVAAHATHMVHGSS
jgi:hypothetical protein